MTPSLMAYYIVAWGNPYTTPTGERELARVAVLRGERCPKELEEMIDANPGYALYWQAPTVVRDPARLWTTERKADVRRANLRKRIERAAPLFADGLMARELARAPDYFEGR